MSLQNAATLRLEGEARHTWHEDVLGILIGTLLVSLGVVIYAKAILLTGGVAGLALLVTYASPVPFWLAFLVLNMPFCWLGWRRKGGAFMGRTFAAVLLECVMTHGAAAWMDIATIDPIFASVVGGVLIGVGLLILFRHDTSLGGVGILALYLEERCGFHSGYVLLVFDGASLALAWPLLEPSHLVFSALGVAVMNGVLVVHHRPDRYVGLT